MAYGISSPVIGTQPIANTETEAKHVIGTIVRANDPIYGDGEFIYLKGVASTVVGSVVTYNSTTGQTTLAPAGANIPQPIAVAMSANVAAQYGWYQISGQAVAAKSTGVMTAGSGFGVPATGVVNVSSTGAEVQGGVIVTTTTAAAATVLVLVNRPHMQGRIT